MLSIIIQMITHNILNKIKRQANNSEQPKVYQFIHDNSSHTASQENYTKQTLQALS